MKAMKRYDTRLILSCFFKIISIASTGSLEFANKLGAC
jgi:hypothetical protein